MKKKTMRCLCAALALCLSLSLPGFSAAADETEAVMPESADLMLTGEEIPSCSVAVNISDLPDSPGQKGGTVTASVKEAKPGDIVNVTARADKGCFLSYIDVQPVVTLTEKEVGSYSFIMPESDVQIDASFLRGDNQGTIGNPWLVGPEGTPDGVIAYIEGDDILFINRNGTGSGVMRDYAERETPYYSYARSIKEAVVGEGVTYLGDYAIYHQWSCSYLTAVTLPESLTCLGAHALSNCDYLTTLTIPGNVQKIGEKCFENDSSLSTVIFKGRPESIAPDAFNGVTADVYISADWLTNGSFCPEDYQFGGKLTYIIEGNAHEHIASVREPAHGKIKLDRNSWTEGETVTVTLLPTDDGYGFYPERFIIEPYVPFTVSASGGNMVVTFAMPACDVVVGAEYKEVGTAERPWLIGQENKADIKAWCEKDPADETKTILYLEPMVQNAAMMDFAADSRPWESAKNAIFKVVVLDGDAVNISRIGENVFSGMTSLEEAELGGTVSIGERAFSGCTSLIKAGMQAVTAIGDEAFSGCTSLTLISTTQALSEIGEKAFSGCTSFLGNNGNETAPLLDLSSVSTLGEEAFADCIFLEKMMTAKSSDAPGTLIVIPTGAFKGCMSLKEITLGSAVTTLEAESFRDCAALRRINIHGSCKNIASTAFRNDSAYVYIRKNFIEARTTGDSQPHINDPYGNWFYGANRLSYSLVTSPGQTDGEHVIRINQTQNGEVLLSRTISTADWIIWMDLEAHGLPRKGEITGIFVNGKAVDGSAIDLEQHTDIDKIPGYERTSRYSFRMPDGDLEFMVNFEDNPSAEAYAGTVPEISTTQTKAGQPWYIGADGSGKVQATLEDGVLNIEYKGPGGTSSPMMDFSAGGTPWYDENDSIRKIVVGEGVTSLGRSAFFGCDNIESVSLPKSLEKIGEDVFYHSALRAINIPEKVNEIGRDAFYRCEELTAVVFGGRPSFIAGDTFRETSTVCYVTDAWLTEGVTSEDLNNKEGNYQFGGNLDYVCPTGTPHQIICTPAEGGEVTAPAPAAKPGSYVMLSVSCDYGCRLRYIRVEGVSVDDDRNAFIMPDRDVTVSAVFEKVEYRVSSRYMEGGRLRTDKSRYTAGELVQIIAETDPGRRLSGLEAFAEDADKAVPIDENGCFTMPDYNVCLNGRTEKIPFTVTVNQTEGGIAYVDDSKGADKEKLFACAGDTLRLTASAAPGKALKKWIIETEDGTVETAAGTYSMPACDISVTPVFDIAYKVTILSAENGKVTSDKSVLFEKDTGRLFIAPAPGYVFDGWAVKPDDLSVEKDGSFTMPAGKIVLQGRFRKAMYAVVPVPAQHGTLTVPSGADYGEKVSFFAVPDVGYMVKNLRVTTDNGDVVTVAGRSFVMPDDNVTVQADFVKQIHKVNLIISGGEAYGTVKLTENTAGTGDLVTFTAVPEADCAQTMETYPFADISYNEETGMYSFVMPPVETDLIISFSPVTDTETYPRPDGNDEAREADDYTDSPEKPERYEESPATGDTAVPALWLVLLAAAVLICLQAVKRLTK